MFVSIQNYQDLLKREDAHIQYEHYMMDIRDPDVVRNIANNLQPAEMVDEVFSEQDIEWLYGYAFSRCGSVRHNSNGTIFISGNLNSIYEKFKDKINKILPGANKSPGISGNFFITPDQYGLHNDSTRLEDWKRTLNTVPLDNSQRKYVPWRNIIIPMWTNPANIESHAIFFKQRHIDFAHVYHHGSNKPIATTYPICRNYSEIDFHLLGGSTQSKNDNLNKYNKVHYDRYLYYTPYNRLTGLESETTCEWKPRCPIVFDAVQLHATNKGTIDTQWNNKMGLLLCFLREVN